MPNYSTIKKPFLSFFLAPYMAYLYQHRSAYSNIVFSEITIWPDTLKDNIPMFEYRFFFYCEFVWYGKGECILEFALTGRCRLMQLTR